MTDRGTQRAERFTETFAKLEATVGEVLRGKQEPVRLALTCLLAEGHLLIEDVSGTGKTSLAKAMADVLAGTWSRIQFTPDLLPSDVTGVSIYDQKSEAFSFRNGPVFANVVVADEINRASPKTQSALLEVMEERQVTVDGKARPVPRPFMVIGTQNPHDHQGTFVLPDGQLDRFTMRISLGYPDSETELTIVDAAASGRTSPKLEAVLATKHMPELVAAVDAVHVADPVRRYLVDLIESARGQADLRVGVSSRATIALTRTAQVSALVDGRSFVLPDDVRALVGPVLEHRLFVSPEAELRGRTRGEVLAAIIESVPVPRERSAA